MSTATHKELSIAGAPLSALPILLLASGVRTAATVDGAAVINRAFARAPVLICTCSLTASSTPTTLDVAVEASLDGGTNWFIIAKFSQFGAVATGIKMLKVSSTGSATIATEVVAATSPTVTGAVAVSNFGWDSWLRASYVLVGTSYTFSVSVLPVLTP